MKKEIDLSYEANHRRLERLVSQEVFCCDTSVVEFILSKGEDEDAPFNWDEVENMYPDNSDAIEEIQDEIDKLEENRPNAPDEDDFDMSESSEEFDKAYDEWDKADNELDAKISELEDKISELEDEQGTPNEPYEWWRVTSWFADKLRKQGEVIIDSGCDNYWGRCCTGQSISLDGVVLQIAKDMKILKGQEHEWSEL